jgi:hypothetical protein
VIGDGSLSSPSAAVLSYTQQGYIQLSALADNKQAGTGWSE